MQMANGTAEPRLSFKPRKTTTEIRPDAPDGEWEFKIPKGKSKVKVTQKGDPMIVIGLKLVKAMDEKNEAHQGSEITFSFIVYDAEDAEKRRAANMHNARLLAFADNVDIDLTKCWPKELTGSVDDFQEFFDEIEGKSGTCWTKNGMERQQNGEETNRTEVLFKDPNKSGLAGQKALASADSDDDDRPGKKNGNGKSNTAARRR